MAPKKRVRDDPDTDDDQSSIPTESTKKKSRATAGSKTPVTRKAPGVKTPAASKTPVAKKTATKAKKTPAAKTAEALVDDVSPELQDRLTASRRKAAPTSTRSTRTQRAGADELAKTQRVMTHGRTPTTQRLKSAAAAKTTRQHMTPPSPELSTQHPLEEAPTNGKGRRSSLDLDGRFAAVDSSSSQSQRHSSSKSSSSSSSSPFAASVSALTKKTAGGSQALVSLGSEGGSGGRSGGAVTRLFLPVSYLVLVLLLLLAATGVLPLGEFGEGQGFGRPTRPGQALVNNVTAHMRTQMAPLSATLATNVQALKGENAELEALARKVDGLESDKAAVKQRLTDAITKVDRMLVSDPPLDPEALMAHVQAATVDMAQLKMNALRLEDAVRGHLQDIAKVLVDSSSSSPESEATKAFFAQWVQQAYREFKPPPTRGSLALVSKAEASELVGEFVSTLSEAECAGLHDFANLKNGARVRKASPTFGEVPSSTSWSSLLLNPFRSGLPPPGTKPPEVALTTGNELGECWPLGGKQGKLVVELANLVNIQSVTLMHIHPKLAPKGGDVSSALKEFKVFAYPEPLVVYESIAGQKTGGGRQEKGVAPLKKTLVYPQKVEVASGTFDKNAGCMTFPVVVAGGGGGAAAAAAAAGTVNANLTAGVRNVELEVLSNHGREELTCLYRFMVHGDPVITATTAPETTA